MFSSVSAPFWWPTKTARRPSMRQKPATTAGSSRNRRSPCSSTTSVHIALTSSSVWSRFTLRAMRTRSHTALRSSSGSITGAVGSTMDQLACQGDRAGAVAARLVDSRRAQVAQQPLDRVAQLVARDDLVHEAVLVQELGALEAFRQLLRDRAGSDARARETDERLWLGQVDVAQRSERGEHAAGGRVGHEADVRHAGLAEPTERCARLGQLHERQRALLHSCSTTRRNDDQRNALGERELRGTCDLLADDRAHRAAHEGEVHDADRDARPTDRARAPLGRIAHTGRGARRGEPLGIGLLVDERQHVDRLQPGILLAKAVAIEEQPEPRVDAQPEVMPTTRADALVLVQRLVVEHLLAVGTARPQICRVLLASTAEWQLDRHQPCLRRHANIAAAPIETPDASAPPISRRRSTTTAPCGACSSAAACSWAARRSSNRNDGWKRGRPFSRTRIT